MSPVYVRILVLSCEVALSAFLWCCIEWAHTTNAQPTLHPFHPQSINNISHHCFINNWLQPYTFACLYQWSCLASFDSLCASSMTFHAPKSVGTEGNKLLRMEFPFPWQASILRLVTLKYLSMAVIRRGGGMVLSTLIYAVVVRVWRLRGGAVSLHLFIHAWMGCQQRTDSNFHSDTGGTLTSDWKNMYHDYLINKLTVF